MISRFSLMLLFFLASFNLCYAQNRSTPNTGVSSDSESPPDVIDTSGGDRKLDLTVKVVLPNNRPAGQNIGVVLESAYGGVVNQTVTNSLGEVTFRNIRGGSYVLRITGAEIRDTVSSISVSPLDVHRVEYVHAQPLHPDGTNSATSTQGSISVASLNIPEKAKKEFEKGNEAFEAGDNTRAEQFYQKAIDVCPKYATAYNNLGALYMKSADKAHAREAWNKALTIDPNLDTANVNVAKLSILDHDYANAIAPLEKALSVHPRSAEVLFLMTQAQFMSKDYERALLYARRVLELQHKQYELAHIVAGRALEAQHHPDQARVEYENLLKEAPNSPEADEAKKSLSRLGRSREYPVETRSNQQ